ncbi:hypothetical protein FB45DRAFT_906866, partial [Roridomyces roridus]
NWDRSFQRIIENFSRGFIENPERAETVRSLLFLRRRNCYVPIDHDLFCGAMKLMKSLERLSFNDWHEPPIAVRLAHLVFPNLSWCSMIGDFSASKPSDFTKFLIRHPSITRFCLLSLGVVLAHEDDTLEDEQPILPNLQWFEGTPLFLHRLGTQNLRALRVGPWDQLTTSDVQALKARTLGSHIDCNHARPVALSLELSPRDRALETVAEDILSPLRAGMPHIQSLQLQTSTIPASCMEALKRISTELSQFSCLAYFAVTHWGADTIDSLAVEAVFEIWVAACPTLKGVCIGAQPFSAHGYLTLSSLIRSARTEESGAEVGTVL